MNERKLIRMRYNNDTGLVEAEALNFQGVGCVQAMSAVLAAAGLEEDPNQTQLKPEYHMQCEQEQQRELS